MFNSRQTDVIDRNTYVDEFEKASANVQTEKSLYEQEKEAFNAKIASNFDRIVRRDTMSLQSEILERNRVYDKYTTAINTDAAPSQTTMQFKGMPRAEIYQDYRVAESQYVSNKVARPRAKLLMACLVAVIMALSVLVVLNTTLLNNMNNLINEKLSQIETLNETKSQYQEVLDDVSDIENIINSATGNGMVG